MGLSGLERLKTSGLERMKVSGLEVGATTATFSTFLAAEKLNNMSVINIISIKE